MPIIGRRSILVGAGAGLIGGVAFTASRFWFGAKDYNAAIYTEDGVAIGGTDPVAYFTQSTPVLGSPDYSARWHGAIWHFASAQNRKTFLSTPERYAPAYGGYCAWAVAEKGQLFSTQPDNWAIVDGRLFLNYNDNVQENWNMDRSGFIKRADMRWPQLRLGLM